MIGQTVRELLEGKVVLDIEGIDRLYLNLYQPITTVPTFNRTKSIGYVLGSPADRSLDQ